MFSSGNIFVIGGDVRLAEAANRLHESGFDVHTLGQGFAPFTLGEGIRQADYILFGVPVSKDGETVFAPLCTEKIFLSDILAQLTQKHTVLAGKPDAFGDELKKRGIRFHDYAEREEFATANAVPTAEGAIEIAMRELPVTLCGSKCLVVGFGRIGKVLCKMLSGMGVRVTAAARSCRDLAMIDAMGLCGVHTEDAAETADEYDFVINTVPHLVITRPFLKKMRKGSVLIDVASKPGGVDTSAAGALGVNVIWALSLPGIVAPVTAGRIIGNTVRNIINDICPHKREEKD